MIPFWFILITILSTGFFILEGFDFGVGILHGVIGGDEAGRRAAINTIGPLWDGNEVWLIVAAAAMFAAFPDWYATMFSAFYMVVVLLLVALILRGVSFEYRGKRDSQRWRRGWDLAMVAGSLATTVTMAGCILSIFTDLYPRVLVSSTSPAFDLTVRTAAGNYSLTVMTIVALIAAVRAGLPGLDLLRVPAPDQLVGLRRQPGTGPGRAGLGGVRGH